MKNYQDQLLQQEININRPACKEYFNFIYTCVSEKLNLDWNSAKGIEIGSGSGISRFFLPKMDIVRTDLMPWNNAHVTGEIDASNLPFKDDLFDFAIGVDVFHHLENPMKALSELKRVVKFEGKIVLVEPYVSCFSYPIYKFFHSEETSWFFNPKKLSKRIAKNPEIGDQGMSKYFFQRSKGKKAVRIVLGDEFKSSVNLISPFSFFLTGGLSNPFRTPQKIISIVLKIERKIPQIFMKFLATRMIICIKFD